MHYIHRFLCMAFVITLSGCGLTSQAIHTNPPVSLNSSVRQSPDQPIHVSIVDDDAAQRDDDFVANLAESICSAYPSSYRIVPASLLPAQGQISMKIFIRRLGAFFNPGTSSVLLRSGYRKYVVGVYNEWRQVVDVAKADELIISGYVGGGSGALVGWSGITFIDIKVFDLRPGKSDEFTVSIAAERSTANYGGFITAYRNASHAWNATAPRLQEFLEASAQKNVSEKVPENGMTSNNKPCM